jgi:hypothetical protein
MYVCMHMCVRLFMHASVCGSACMSACMCTRTEVVVTSQCVMVQALSFCLSCLCLHMQESVHEYADINSVKCTHSVHVLLLQVCIHIHIYTHTSTNTHLDALPMFASMRKLSAIDAHRRVISVCLFKFRYRSARRACPMLFAFDEF